MRTSTIAILAAVVVVVAGGAYFVFFKTALPSAVVTPGGSLVGYVAAIGADTVSLRATDVKDPVKTTPIVVQTNASTLVTTFFLRDSAATTSGQDGTPFASKTIPLSDLKVGEQVEVLLTNRRSMVAAQIVVLPALPVTSSSSTPQ